MSAYAAFKENPDTLSFNSVDDSDNNLIQYEQNTSDDESLENEEMPQMDFNIRSNIQSRQPTPFRLTDVKTCSNFIPNDDNFIISKEYICIGLKVNEFVILNGQFKLSIQRGAIMINNFHYIYANPNNSFNFIAPSSHALPIISSTQVLDRTDIIDVKTEENSHLFSSEYKSVIKIENLYTGLENIGIFYLPFKNLFHNSSFDPNELLDDHEKLFKTYSFEIILRNKGLSAMSIDKIWGNSISSIVHGLDDNPKVIMVIGNKNTGKSTLSKSIANSILLEKKLLNVSYFDLDPGQSEFSMPYCLSLTNLDKPVFGINIPSNIPDKLSSVHTEYYGFSTPQNDPQRYISIIESLYKRYVTNDKPKGNHLVINTPGWIKGYGKELLIQITEIIKPDNLIVLSNNFAYDSPEIIDVLEGLHFNDSKLMQGIYQSSKYSPSQLRIFSKLCNIYQRRQLEFDFTKHILNSSPFKVSYETSTRTDRFIGINAVSILNFDTEVDFNIQDLPSMIEATIFGIYVVENELFNVSAKVCQSNNTLPNYINSSDLLEFINISDSKSFAFMGLSIIHSINLIDGYLNMYIPSQIMTCLRDYVMNGYKIILVRGDGELPPSEMLMKELLAEHDNDVNRYNKRVRKGLITENENVLKLPYISFENKNKVGGIWKVRRNIMRRGHKR